MPPFGSKNGQAGNSVSPDRQLQLFYSVRRSGADAQSDHTEKRKGGEHMAFMFGVIPMLLLSPILIPFALIEGAAQKIWELITSLFPNI